jgi:HlyD family secretion protein
MRLLLTSLSLLALVSAMPAASFAQTAEPAATEAPSLPAISVTTVASRMMEDHILASGLVAPMETVYVAPLIEGQQIEQLLADVGDSVTKGQVLATLSEASLSLQKTQLLASLASAKAQIAQAEAQLADARNAATEAQRTADRTGKLKASGNASTAANDQAQAAAVSANSRVAVAVQTLAASQAQLTLVEAQIANVDLQLARTSVVAPVSGEITARNAQLGAVASAAGQPMFTLIRDGALELRADVAEADLPRVAKGQKATLTLASGLASQMGEVRLVEPSLDVATRLGRARITIPADSGVRSGMFAEADIIIAAHEGLAVPVTAVGSADGQSTVMKVTDGVVSRVAVTTGIRQGGWIEVLSGLAAGDTIVSKAGAFVSDGDKINPIPTQTN